MALELMAKTSDWKTAWGLGLCMTIVLPLYDMRDKHYKIKSIRLSEETWENLKIKKGDKSWNLFMVELLEKTKKKHEKQ